MTGRPMVPSGEAHAFKARYTVSPVIGLLAAGFSALAYARMEPSDRIGMGFVFLSVGLGSILAVLFQDWRYVVGNGFVRIHRGPFRRHVALASIRAVGPTDVGDAGLVKARRLALRDAQGRRLAVVRPEDPAEFVAALEAACHPRRVALMSPTWSTRSARSGRAMGRLRRRPS